MIDVTTINFHLSVKVNVVILFQKIKQGPRQLSICVLNLLFSRQALVGIEGKIPRESPVTNIMRMRIHSLSVKVNVDLLIKQGPQLGPSRENPKGIPCHNSDARAYSSGWLAWYNSQSSGNNNNCLIACKLVL